MIIMQNSGRWCRAILPYPAVAPHPSILPFIRASLFQHEKLLVERNGRQAKNSEPNLVPFLLELFCQRMRRIKSSPYREHETYIFYMSTYREKAGKKVFKTPSSVWFRKAKKYLKNKFIIEELGVLFRGLGNFS